MGMFEAWKDVEGVLVVLEVAALSPYGGYKQLAVETSEEAAAEERAFAQSVSDMPFVVVAA